MGKKFSRKRRLNKTNIEKTPKDKPVVYKLKNKDNKNIYTGVAKKGRGPDRLKEHLPGGKDPIPGATNFSVKPKPSIESAKVEEKKIIRKEKPEQNEANKP